jgi:hypothetical protein
MRPNNAAPRASDAHPDWEAPAFTKLPIAGGTGSGADAAPPRAEPAAPGQPSSKLGFSFEWSFPMSTRD